MFRAERGFMMKRMSLALALMLGLAGAAAVPAAAQQFSEGYTFLKGVRDRNGTVVTEAVERPGSTVINARDLSSGETALHIVTERRDATWLRFLTGKGADPNIADKRGRTPLQIAANLGFVDGVEVLLAAGARVDPTDRTGETPLIAAVHQNNLALVRLLLSKGANPDHADNSGRTALDYARLAGERSPMVQEFTRAAAERSEQGRMRTYGPGA